MVTPLPMATGIADLGGGIDLAVLADPDIFAGLGGGHLEDNAAFQGVILGLAVDLKVTDIAPVGRRQKAEEGLVLCQELGKDVVAEAIGDARGNDVKDFRLEDINAGVGGVGEDAFAPWASPGSA